MANLSSKEDWISRQLEAIQSKPSFTGRVSSCLPSSPPSPSRAAQGLLRPEERTECLTVSLTRKGETENQALTRLQTQGGSKNRISLAPWGHAQGARHGGRWAPGLGLAPTSTLSILSQEEPFPCSLLTVMKKGGAQNTREPRVCPEPSSSLSQQQMGAAKQVPRTFCR